MALGIQETQYRSCCRLRLLRIAPALRTILDGCLDLTNCLNSSSSLSIRLKLYVEPEQFLKALNGNKIDIAFLVFPGPYNNCQFETNVATDRQCFLSGGLIFPRRHW